jgi:antitoxin HicB
MPKTVKSTDINQALDYYSKLPYNIILEQWDDGAGPYWVARVLELPHCLIHGDTPEEAIKEIEGVKRDWIRSNLERGLSIPEPVAHSYSGQIRLRMPAYLHRLISERASAEGISINQYMVALLANSVGAHKISESGRPEYRVNPHRARKRGARR